MASESVWIPARARLGRGAGRDQGRLPWTAVLGLPLLLFLALPLAALLGRASLMEVWSNLGRPEVYQAVRLSLLSSLLATAAAVILGTPLAYLLARHDFRFKRVVDAVLDLPTVLPPAVAGVALLMAFGRRGLLGGWLELWGIHVAFTPLAVVMAQTFIAAPLFLKSAAVGLAGVEAELEQAAALDGASPWQVFRHVTVPLAWTGLLTGAVLTWARALGEFGATIIFAGNFAGRTQTMPLAIYLGFELDLSVALTLSVILIGLSFLTLLLLKALLGRR